jgi:putative ABC transport system substrate-binding protein
MKRREFITLLGGAAAWPLAAHAQQSLPVVGYLGIESPAQFAGRLSAFREGLSSTGYDEGRNVLIEYRWANSQGDRLPALAADLVRNHVNVIAAPGSILAALAAKAATTTITIVFETGVDPVEAGLVASLNRPSGNITGVTSLNVEVGAKRLELLHELVPDARSFGVLLNPANPVVVDVTMKKLKESSHAFGLQLHILNASTETEIAGAFAKLDELRVGGLLIASDPFFSTRAQALAALALKHSLPAILQAREFAASGGLMSFGGDIRETHKQAGIYTGRILRGERPADLPVQQVTKVVLILNLKTAKALGLKIPLPILGRADEVIE